LKKQKTTKQTLLEEESKRPRQDKSEQECTFCKIAKQKMEDNIVFRDEISTAFLDMKPLFLGHCLLIPNEHYTSVSELPSILIKPFFTNVRLLAIAIEKGLHADGSFIAINNKVSQSVPHLHVHIVPRRFGDGLRGFFYPRLKYSSPEEERKIQQVIKSAILELQPAQNL
jgi:histidine triad (HIT) family protein